MRHSHSKTSPANCAWRENNENMLTVLTIPPLDKHDSYIFEQSLPFVARQIMQELGDGEENSSVYTSVVTIPNVAMRHVSRYLGHDAIRIAILVYRVSQCLDLQK